MSPRARFLLLAALRVGSAALLAMAGYLFVRRGVDTDTLTAAVPLVGAGLVGIVWLVPALTHRWRTPEDPR